MKKVILIAFALSACAPLGDLIGNNGTAISNAAAATTLDEQAGIYATDAYTAASLLGAKLVKAGLLDKAKFQAADNKGYTAVLALHAAYEAGNQPNYSAAIAKTYGAVTDIKALVK